MVCDTTPMQMSVRCSAQVSCLCHSLCLTNVDLASSMIRIESNCIESKKKAQTTMTPHNRVVHASNAKQRKKTRNCTKIEKKRKENRASARGGCGRSTRWHVTHVIAIGSRTEDKRRGDVDKEDKTGETKLHSGELDRSTQQTIAHSSTQ